MRRIAVAGGTPITICDLAIAPFGINWDGDWIVAGQGSNGIVRVAAGGGTPEQIVKVEPTQIAHGPQILPGGRNILFTLAPSTGPNPFDRAQIVVQSLSSGERTVLVEGGSDARYLPAGHLVYAVQGTLLAVPFDVGRLQVTGAAVPVIEGVRRPVQAPGNSLAAQFSVAANGTAVYVAGAARAGFQDLAFSGRDGSREPLNLPPDTYRYPRLLPDGRQLVVGTDDMVSRCSWRAIRPCRMPMSGSCRSGNPKGRRC
ncbi:MAG: hypothetical protein A3F70_00595 [Acidobacteria bacterium RIFCSPLOWO2_12_FULL_67_14]|nr:MAG: hypothetical protein A3H29_12880 [Acidobacteria bacterium RIFCSPLOWO2_02_FULL_67_21]OFW38767.1 MAG: hypothetical protein A3F70_00595 [Acidobacteria bacterium RIFCSPLOWO2_12_FULL_67_14]